MKIPNKSAVLGMLSGCKSSAEMKLEGCAGARWKGQSLLQMGKFSDSGNMGWTGSGGRWAEVHFAYDVAEALFVAAAADRPENTV